MNYYCLIAGLPEINAEDGKLPFSLESFKAEVLPQLSEKDRKLIDLFFTKFDNKNLLLYLKDKDAILDPRGNLSKEDLEEGLIRFREDDKPQSPYFPPYFKEFINEYIEVQHITENILWEDKLSEQYYKWAMQCNNRMIAEWFEFNLNINNVLTAFACRKYQIDAPSQIIGDNEVAQLVSSSSQRDFGLGGVFNYFDEIQHIAEESDLFERERKIDLLRWKWLDEQTFFKNFGIEQVFAYLVKLEIISRWVELDPESGEKIFRELIGRLKESVVSGRESINLQLNEL